MGAQIMKPRVLVLTKLFWPEGSGGELATYLIIKNILSKHFDVFIVSGTRKPIADVLRLAKYVYWSVLETKYKPIEWLKLFVNTHWLRKLIEGADVVYIPSHTLIPMAVVAKHLKPKVKVVLHLHNYQVLTFTSVVLAGRRPDVATDIIVEYEEHESLARALMAGIGHYVNYVNRYALKYVDRVICVSERQCEIILKYLPKLRDRTIVVYNPLPPFLNVDKRITNEPALVYASGDSYIKGFHVLIQAALNISKQGDSVEFLLTGGRRLNSRREQLMERLNGALKGKFKLLGFLPYDDVLKLYSKSHAVLVPSIWEEPLPYVVMEAMAMGTLPIASRIGGIPEIVEGTFAEKMLFTPSNVNELVDRIEYVLLLSKDQFMEIGFNLRKGVLRRFNVNIIGRQLLKVF